MANIPFHWHLTQSNGYDVELNTVQLGNEIHGNAFETSIYENAAGDIEGSLIGNDFVFTVDWRNGTTGVYSGTFCPGHTASGFTYPVGHPEFQANWSSSDFFWF